MRLRPTARDGVWLVEADEKKASAKNAVPNVVFEPSSTPATPKKTSLYKSTAKAARNASSRAREDVPEIDFAPDNAATTPRKKSLYKTAVRAAQQKASSGDAKTPDVEFAPDEAPRVPKKASLFKRVSKTAQQAQAKEPDEDEATAKEPDEEEPDEDETEDEGEDDQDAEQEPEPEPEPPAELPKAPGVPTGRTASFRSVVARLQKRYKSLRSSASRIETEHVGVYSVISEEQGTPLILMEEANWQKGIWISLWPTEKVQRRLSRIGGVPADEIHLTLVYVGRIDKTTHADVATIASVCERVARGARPFTGQVTGIGRFSATVPEDLDTIYASFTSPRLDDLRGELLRQLDRAGISHTQKYGFTPHMTLGKIPQRAISPLERLDPFRLRFSWLTLKVGTWRHDYKLGRGD